jgi:hypothetical protein
MIWDDIMDDLCYHDNITLSRRMLAPVPWPSCWYPRCARPTAGAALREGKKYKIEVDSEI